MCLKEREGLSMQQEGNMTAVSKVTMKWQLWNVTFPRVGPFISESLFFVSVLFDSNLNSKSLEQRVLFVSM